MKMIAGLLLPACLKELAHAFGADAYEDLGEIAAVHIEESRVRLTGNGFGEHGFAGAGWAR